MSIPTLYKGDDTAFKDAAALSVSLKTDFDLAGCAVELSFCGLVRSFSGLSGREVSLPLHFTSAETAAMPVGTHKGVVRVTDANGRVRTAADSVRIRVTDCVAEAYAPQMQTTEVSLETGGLDLSGVTLDLDAPQESINAALAAIVAAGGGTVKGGE